MKKLVLFFTIFIIVITSGLWAEDYSLNEEQQKEVQERIESWDVDIPDVFWNSELRVKGGANETHEDSAPVKDVFRDVIFIENENLDGSVTTATIEPIQIKGNEVVLSFQVFRKFDDRIIVDNELHFYLKYYKDENYSYLYKVYSPDIKTYSANDFEIVASYITYASALEAMGIEN